jgi:hypothetical protein
MDGCFLTPIGYTISRRYAAARYAAAVLLAAVSPREVWLPCLAPLDGSARDGGILRGKGGIFLRGKAKLVILCLILSHSVSFCLILSHSVSFYLILSTPLLPFYYLSSAHGFR